MTVQIDTTAENNGLRLVKQGSHPASPSAGHVIAYYVTGTATPGLFIKDDVGQQIGPFITGTALSGGGRVLIQESMPTGTTASFSSGLSGYKKLIIEYVARSTKAGNFDSLAIQLNGDNTATNYRFIQLGDYGGGATDNTGGDTNTVGYISANSSPANSAGVGIIEIIQPSGTAFNKYIHNNMSYRSDASSIHMVNFLYKVEWENTSAITTIDLILGTGNFTPGSVLRLYGES